MSATEVKQLAADIGVATSLIVEHILEQSSHPAIGCRKSYGFLRLAKSYGNTMLEQTCQYAINIGVSDYKIIGVLLERKIVSSDNHIIQHTNIRGANYYCN